MSEWSFVVAAYGLTWIVLGGYAVYVRGRIRHAETALADATARGEDDR